MSKETKSKKGLREEERRRYDYMIAWRERYIEKQREMLEGREEERGLLLALLSLAFGNLLTGQSEGIRTQPLEGGDVLVEIQKEAVRGALGRWQLQCTENEEAFALTFSPAKEAEDAAAENGSEA